MFVMEPRVWWELEKQRFSIRARWNTLLRAARPSSALANPDTLVFRMDATFEAVLRECAGGPAVGRECVPSAACVCGMNPYLRYFDAARQALHEGLVHSASVGSDDRRLAHFLQRLDRALTTVAHREIDGFCGACLRCAPSARWLSTPKP